MFGLLTGGGLPKIAGDVVFKEWALGMMTVFKLSYRDRPMTQSSSLQTKDVSIEVVDMKFQNMAVLLAEFQWSTC